MPPTYEDIRFSVVIPTYNRGHLVGRAIESALEQSVAPEEIVVVDDGSTDGTASVLARFGELIRYLPRENGGCSAARNFGVAQAGAEWIALLDSDDTWLPAHLEAMREAIVATGGGADLYFGNSWFCRSPGRERSLWSVSDFEISADQELRADASDWMMSTRQPLKLQASVVKRSAWDRVGGLDEALRTREDTHFFLRLGLGHPMCAVRDAGVDVGEDDDPENRLTTALPPDSRAYLEATAYLYGDVLRRDLARRTSHRAELRKRYARACLRLARLDLREHAWTAACTRAVKGAWAAPETLPGMLLRGLRNSPHVCVEGEEKSETTEEKVASKSAESRPIRR